MYGIQYTNDYMRLTAYTIYTLFVNYVTNTVNFPLIIRIQQNNKSFYFKFTEVFQQEWHLLCGGFSP